MMHQVQNLQINLFFPFDNIIDSLRFSYLTLIIHLEDKLLSLYFMLKLTKVWRFNDFDIIFIVTFNDRYIYLRTFS